jgi:hypothetical protein
MDESMRNDIIRMFYSRASQRRIAKTLAVDRKTVAKIIAEHEEAQRGAPLEKRKPRKSILGPFQDNIVQLLERYPEITAVRMLEELRRLGFSGANTIVRDRLRQLRRRPRLLIRRFEKPAGLQAQMDYSPYPSEFGTDCVDAGIASRHNGGLVEIVTKEIVSWSADSDLTAYSNRRAIKRMVLEAGSAISYLILGL